MQVENKKVYLYHERAICQKLTQEYTQTLPKVQALKDAGENLIGRRLKSKEAELLFLDKESFVANVKKIVSGKFKFPDSPEAFNLASLGLSYDELEMTAGAVPDQQQFLFDVDDKGKFELLDSELERIEEAGHIFTSNTNQFTAVKELENIVTSLSILKEIGIEYHNQHILRAFNSLLNMASDGSLSVDTHHIKNIPG